MITMGVDGRHPRIDKINNLRDFLLEHFTKLSKVETELK